MKIGSVTVEYVIETQEYNDGWLAFTYIGMQSHEGEGETEDEAIESLSTNIKDYYC